MTRKVPRPFVGKNILVTGGTGSFGQQFVRTLLREHEPRRVVVFSRDELKQSEMARAFVGQDGLLRFFIGDVRDLDRLRRAMRGIDVVVHAAALKQVPACEYNPLEAVKTNIRGAENIIEAAIDCDVKKVMALSTDKAVNPVNLYGATKLVAEKLFVQGNAYAGATGPRFSCVRYGNVVGSRGSVVPLFNEQRKTGRVTVTDPAMTRFWITLEQGVQFVIGCTEAMRGGEVFIPKLPSMNIMDVAKVIAPGCKVETIGIRPGEKLHEVMLSAEEARSTIEFPDRYVIQPQHAYWETKPIAGGKSVPPGFTYASDNNHQWLTQAELRKMIGDAA